ncbi:hypothetical protein HDU84_003097 [Entophlyctis sp. JEL0112]|nr:hypothetical protein HDU84_003097 [Entophlyctis sp. JEL0112]
MDHRQGLALGVLPPDADADADADAAQTIASLPAAYVSFDPESRAVVLHPAGAALMRRALALRAAECPATKRIVRALHPPPPPEPGNPHEPRVPSCFDPLPIHLPAVRPAPIALLPFQERALRWMLHRETGPHLPPRPIPLFCEIVRHTRDQSFAFNRLTGEITATEDAPTLACDNIDDIRGGILADEMGLGKTVEIIALIQSHPASETSVPPVTDAQVFKLPSRAKIDGSARKCLTCGGTAKLIQCGICATWTHQSHSAIHSDVPETTKNRAAHLFACVDCKSEPPDPLPTGATLIICPPTILSQWIGEIETHAPNIPFYVYGGRMDGDNISFQELSTKSIVLTTYTVLRSELHFARPDSDRPRRTCVLATASSMSGGAAARKYARPRSPLKEIKWWRCVMDEAQMVEASASAAAEMARMLPRVHAWAVTGTPVSAKSAGLTAVARDLRGLCQFLDVLPFSAIPDRRIADLLAHDPGTVKEGFAELMHRNTKASVQDELVLPQQTQYVVELEFSPVERDYYDEFYSQCIKELEKLNGEAIGKHWSSDFQRKQYIEKARSKMRSWLLQLRQMCCHPQIGEHNKNILGAKVVTIQEVLESMRRQNTITIGSVEATLINLRIKKAHLYEFSKDYEHAINVYEAALIDIRARIKKLRADLTAFKTKSSEVEDIEELDDVAHDLPAGDADHRKVLSTQLGSFKELEHQAIFFIACCFNSMESTELETKYYEQAETLRRQILGDFEAVVEKRRAAFFGDAESTRAVVRAIADVKNWRKSKESAVHSGGVVIRTTLKSIQTLFSRLNRQWDNVLARWRTRILELLNTSLHNEEQPEEQNRENPDNKGPSGEEYAQGAELQIELDILMDNYTEILAERREILNGTVFTNSKQNDEELLELEVKCREERKEYSLAKGESNLTAILKELKHMAENTAMPGIERDIALMSVTTSSQGVDLHLNCLAELQRELTKLRRLANARIAFYRHLQAISDSLVSPDKPANLESTLQSTQLAIAKTEVSLATHIGRSKYLESLSAKSNDAAAPANAPGDTLSAGEGQHSPPEENECLICRSSFLEGYISECGHLYCDYCMRLWVGKRRSCAMCKHPLPDIDKNLTKITSIVRKISAVTELNDSSFDKMYQHRLPAQVLDRIVSRKLDTTASFGTKTDFLLRHLLDIQATYPGAKSIIFSQWDAVLDVIATGCNKNGIRFVQFDAWRTRRRNAKDIVAEFRDDPGIQVLMLNARSQSSGLTVVCATHVFLIEPVVNVGMDLQGMIPHAEERHIDFSIRPAINRVHRIGQTRETFVYRYIIKNTVEGHVYWLQNQFPEVASGKKAVHRTTGEFVSDAHVEWCLVGDNGLDGLTCAAARGAGGGDDATLAGPEQLSDEGDQLLRGQEEDGAAAAEPQAHGAADIQLVADVDANTCDTAASCSRRAGTGRSGKKRKRGDGEEMQLRVA